MKKYLYSITDFGVEAYVIEQDGELTCINHAPINGNERLLSFYRL